MTPAFSVIFLIDRVNGLYKIQLTDESDYTGAATGYGFYKITYPDGITVENINPASPDFEIGDSDTELSLRMKNGKFYTGAYSVEQKIYTDIGDFTLVKAFTLAFVEPVLSASDNSAIATPVVSFLDDTDYVVPGYTSTKTRLFSSYFPTTSDLDGTLKSTSTSELIMVDSGNYYEGIYYPDLLIDAVYSSGNHAVNWIAEKAFTFDVRKFVGYANLLSVINTFKDNIKTGKDEQTYQMIMSLYSHLLAKIASGDTGIQELVAEILELATGNCGCGSYAYQSGPITVDDPPSGEVTFPYIDQVVYREWTESIPFSATSTIFHRVAGKIRWFKSKQNGNIGNPIFIDDVLNDTWWEEIITGGIPGESECIVRTKFTYEGGPKVFALPYDPEGIFQFYVAGILQDKTLYSFTGSIVTFTGAVAIGEIVDIFSTGCDFTFTDISTSDVIRIADLTYSGSSVFTLPEPANYIFMVFKNGKKLDPEDYDHTINSDEITIIEELDLEIEADRITVYYAIDKSFYIASFDPLKDVSGGFAANDTSIYSLNTVDQFAGLNRRNRTRFYVNDVDRGGMFSYVASGVTANGGTVFAVSDGYAVRQYTGDAHLKWWGPAGDGVTNDAEKIQAAIDLGGVILSDDTDYSIGTTVVTIPSNRRVSGGINSRIIASTGRIEIYGSKGPEFTELSISANKGATSITVSDASSFSPDDYVEITQSLDYFENSTNKPGSELNKIVSIDADVITLESPLSNDYPLYPSEPSILHKVADVKENIEIKNITLSASIRFSYVNNLKISTNFLGNRTVGDGVNFGSSRNVDVESYSVCDISLAFPNSCFYFYNVSNLAFNIKVENAPMDAVRVWGCSKVSGKFDVNNVKHRSLNLYNSQDCAFISCAVLGDVVQTGNYETILVNYSENIRVDTLYVDEPNKSGDTSVFEFRGRSKNVCLINSVIHNYVFTPITVKAKAVNSLISNNIVYNKYAMTANAAIIDLQGDDITGEECLTVTNNTIIASGSEGCVLVRCASDSSFEINSYKSLIIEGNTIDRNSGSIALLEGEITGEPITLLSIKNNICLKNNISSGSLVNILRPVSDAIITSNFLTEVGSRSLICSSADRVLIEKNKCFSYVLSGYAVARIDGLCFEESSGVDPSSSEWKIGDVVEFSSTSDAARSGVYIKNYSSVFVKLVQSESNGGTQVFKDSITLEKPAANSYIRFVESNGFQGAFINYDGVNNILKIGVHNTADSLESSDITILSLPRAGGYFDMVSVPRLSMTSPVFQFNETDRTNENWAFLASSGVFSLRTANSAFSSYVTRLQVLQSGFFGFGNITPSVMVDVEGSIRVRTVANAIGNFATWAANGTLQQRTAVQSADDILKSISGYNAAVAQKLEHDSSGNLTWVNI